MYASRVNVNQVSGQQIKFEEVAGSRSAGSKFRAYAAALRRYLLPRLSKEWLPSMTRFQVLLFFSLLVYAILFSFMGIAYKVWIDPVRLPGRRVGFNEFVGDRTGVLPWADDAVEFVDTFITRLSSFCIYSACLLVIISRQFYLPDHWNFVSEFQFPSPMGGPLDFYL